MSKLVDFPIPEQDDIYSMSDAELKTLLQRLYAKIGELDEFEPDDMLSEEYEEWGEKHEELEDFIEIVEEMLEE